MTRVLLSFKANLTIFCQYLLQKWKYNSSVSWCATYEGTKFQTKVVAIFRHVTRTEMLTSRLHLTNKPSLNKLFSQAEIKHNSFTHRTWLALNSPCLWIMIYLLHNKLSIYIYLLLTNARLYILFLFCSF